MKFNKQAKAFSFLFGFFILGVGIVVGIAIRQYHNLSIAETINIVDVAALITTIFFAVYIPEVMERRRTVKQDRKELIEQRIEELQSLYRRVNMLVQQEANTLKDNLTIHNSLDIAVGKLDTIIALMTYAQMHDAFAKDLQEIKALTEEHRHLVLSEQITEEGFQHTKEEMDREEILYNKIDNTTCLLVFKMNEL